MPQPYAQPHLDLFPIGQTQTSCGSEGTSTSPPSPTLQPSPPGCCVPCGLFVADGYRRFPHSVRPGLSKTLASQEGLSESASKKSDRRGCPRRRILKVKFCGLGAEDLSEEQLELAAKLKAEANFRRPGRPLGPGPGPGAAWASRFMSIAAMSRCRQLLNVLADHVLFFSRPRRGSEITSVCPLQGCTAVDALQ